MCLKINTVHLDCFEGRYKSFTARTDLEVIKVLNEYSYGFYTPYMNKQISFKDGKSLMKAGGNGAHLTKRKSYSVNQGIHSYYDYNKSGDKSYFEYYNCKKHKSVIPKGTNYFVGIDGDVVSEKLLVFKTDEDFFKYCEEGNQVRLLLFEINDESSPIFI